MFVALAFAKVFQLADDDVLRRCDPKFIASQLLAPPMLECPVVQWIARRDEDVRLQHAGVVDEIEHAALTTAGFHEQRLRRRHVVFRLRECRPQRTDIGDANQDDEIDIHRRARLTVHRRGERTGEAVRQAAFSQGADEIGKALRCQHTRPIAGLPARVPPQTNRGVFSADRKLSSRSPLHSFARPRRFSGPPTFCESPRFARGAFPRPSQAGCSRVVSWFENS